MITLKLWYVIMYEKFKLVIHKYPIQLDMNNLEQTYANIKKDVV